VGARLGEVKSEERKLFWPSNINFPLNPPGSLISEHWPGTFLLAILPQQNNRDRLR
jgi:hypothetical protein